MPARSPPSFLGCPSVLNSTWAGTQGDVLHLSAQVWMIRTALAEPKIVSSRCVGGHGGLDACLGATSFGSADETAPMHS